MSSPDDEPGGRWKERARKLEARRGRMRKHGQSLITVLLPLEKKKAQEGRSGPKRRGKKRKR